MSSSDSPDGTEQHVETSPNSRYIRYGSVLGRGAYKTVYKAFDTEEALEVAWNKLHVDRLSEHDLEKVSNEVSLLRQVEHNNIIHFYDTWRGVDANGVQTINFITEQMMSGTLKEYLKKAKAIKLKVIRRWCRNILEAIAYLHTQNPPIMHRDLKCDNIFINGHVGEVKIGDLGLSGVKEREKADSVIGTPEFMAPELYEESYTEKVDIYAFGMCLLEIVTMEYPYSECNNMAQIFKKVFNGEKPQAFEMLVEGDVKDVIAACLQREARRPSAVDLLRHPLFSEWDKDDGRISNLSLVKGTPENTSNSLADTQSSGSMPIGTGLIEWSDPLKRNVLVSMLEGEGGQGEDQQQVSVIAENNYGAFYIGLEIPIRDAIKRVEFTFDPFEDNSSHIAQEMVSEFGLSEEQLNVIRAEIDRQVQTAREQREAASRNATPQPPPREGDAEPKGIVDQAAPVVPLAAQPEQAQNDHPPTSAPLPSSHVAPSMSPQISVSPASVQTSTEPTLPPQPELVSPLEAQHQPTPDLVTPVVQPAASPDPASLTEVVLPPPSSEHIPTSVSIGSHVAEPNGVVVAPAEVSVNPTDVAVSVEANDSAATDLSMEHGMHTVIPDAVPNLNQDQLTSEDIVTAPITENPESVHSSVDISSAVNQEAVPERVFNQEPAIPEAPLDTNSVTTIEVSAPTSQPHSELQQTPPFDPISSGPVEASGGAPSTSMRSDGYNSNSLHSNNALLQVVQKPNVDVVPVDPTYVDNANTSIMPGSEVMPVPNEIPNADISELPVSQQGSLDQTSSVEHHVYSVVTDFPSQQSGQVVMQDQVLMADQGSMPMPTSSELPTHTQPMAVHNPAHEGQVALNPFPTGSADIPPRPPSTPITPEPSVIGIPDEPHAPLPTSHPVSLGSEHNLASSVNTMGSSGNSVGFTSSGSVGEGLRQKRTIVPKPRPNSTIPVIVVVPNEPTDAGMGRGRISSEHSASAGELDNASIHSSMLLGDISSEYGNIGRGVSPEPRPSVTISTPPHNGHSQGRREHSSPPTARMGSGVSSRSVGSLSDVKERMAMTDAEASANLHTLCLKLMELSAFGKFQGVQSALEGGCPPTFADFDKRTPLHVAAEQGHVEVCRLLIEKGAELNAKDKWGNTPLSEAQENNHVDVEALLLKQGAVDEMAAVDMVSLNLMQFSAKGNGAVVRDLLASGAQVSYADYAGRTALHVACAEGQEEVADILLLNGADPCGRDKKGKTPVDHAITNGRRSILRLLRQYGAVMPRQVFDSEPDLVRLKGLELIDHCASGELEKVKSVLDFGADVNFRDYDSRTALHLACAEGCLDVVELLLQNGAETLARDRWDSTPYDEASKGGFRDILEELRSVEFQRSHKQGAGVAAANSLSMNGHAVGMRGGVDSVHFDQLSLGIAQSASLGAIPNINLSADDFAAKYPSSGGETLAAIGSLSSVSLPLTPFDRGNDVLNDDLGDEKLSQQSRDPGKPPLDDERRRSLEQSPPKTVERPEVTSSQVADNVTHVSSPSAAVAGNDSDVHDVSQVSITSRPVEDGSEVITPVANGLGGTNAETSTIVVAQEFNVVDNDRMKRGDVVGNDVPGLQTLLPGSGERRVRVNSDIQMLVDGLIDAAVSDN